MEQPKLTDLIDVTVLQKIQDGFSEFTGMAALMTDEEGIPVTEGSGFSDFCMNFTRQSELGRKGCEECDKQGALKTLENGQPTVYRCHAGLVDYAVPILLEGRFIGSFIGGQISVNALDMERIRQTARQLGIDEDDYVEAAGRILVKDKEEVNRAARFLYLLGSVISEMALKSSEELRKSRKMEHAAQSQAAFILNMNTEFKSRVRAWLGVAKKAVESRDGAEMENAVKRFLVQGPTVLSDLSDAVSYAKMTGGKLELRETEYNIEDLLRFVCHNVEVYLEDKALVIIRQVDDDVPARLLGDEGRIGQVISRLLMHSIQCTEEGVIDIHVSSEKVGYAEHLVIELSDTSAGLPKEVVDDVNLYFQQGNEQHFEKRVQDEVENAGLSMISFLVKQMSGTIEIGSEEGKGTHFTIKLPQLRIW